MAIDIMNMSEYSSSTGPSAQTLPIKKSNMVKAIDKNISDINGKKPRTRGSWFKEMDLDPSVTMICLKVGNTYLYKTKRALDSGKPWFGELKSDSEVIEAFEACKELIKSGSFDEQITDAMARSKRKK